jgi:hypothetical protein
MRFTAVAAPQTVEFPVLQSSYYVPSVIRAPEPYRAVTKAVSYSPRRSSCGGQSGIGARSLRVLRFPLPILIPLTAQNTSSSVTRPIPKYQKYTVWGSNDYAF